jgi:hypothetical protein
MYLKPTLNPDEIFNQLADMNHDRQVEIYLEDEFNRISNTYKITCPEGSLRLVQGF